MKPLLSCAVVCAVLLVPAVSAAPITLFSTFGPGGSYDNLTSYILGGGSDLGGDGFTIAAMFTPSDTAPLAGIELAAYWEAGSTTAYVDLCVDSSGEPGGG